MVEKDPVVIDGNKYTWDGRFFEKLNKAKAHARRYLRQGFKVHMETENGHYLLFRWRPWPFEPALPDRYRPETSSFNQSFEDNTSGRKKPIAEKKTFEKHSPICKGGEQTGMETKNGGKPVLVVCAGYPYSTDTAFGSHVAKVLQENHLPDHVECLDIGEHISEIPHLIDRRDKLIVVDILKTDDPPGTLYRLRPEEIFQVVGGGVDANKYHILQTIYELQVTGDCKESVFIGVNPEDISTAGETLTACVSEKIPAVIDMVLDEAGSRR